MASISPQSTRAGIVPVAESAEAKLGQLIVHAAALADGQISRGLGLYTCEECCATWTPEEIEKHVDGCRVGRVRQSLKGIMDGSRRVARERSFAEPADQAAGAVGERPCAAFEYDEPWRFGWHATEATAQPGIVGFSGDFVPTQPDWVYERIVACVNYCAGISNEMLASLIPLRELGIGAVGKGVDALLAKKGGAR